MSVAKWVLSLALMLILLLAAGCNQQQVVLNSNPNTAAPTPVATSSVNNSLTPISSLISTKTPREIGEIVVLAKNTASKLNIPPRTQDYEPYGRQTWQPGAVDKWPSEPGSVEVEGCPNVSKRMLTTVVTEDSSSNNYLVEFKVSWIWIGEYQYEHSWYFEVSIQHNVKVIGTMGDDLPHC